jgi:hypothetical protein
MYVSSTLHEPFVVDLLQTRFLLVVYNWVPPEVATLEVCNRFPRTTTVVNQALPSNCPLAPKLAELPLNNILRY